MTTENLLPVLLPAFILPPGISIMLLAFAVLARRAGTRWFFLMLGLLSLYLSSISVTSAWLRSRLEVYPTVSLERLDAKAIVVLGADRSHDAPEYGGDTMTRLGLERLRYAARLQKQTGLPVLASGGSVNGEPVPEAELMRAILHEFGVETRWVEGKSRNTYENALFSSRILKQAGADSILLVTHAWHMPRALEAFEKAGMRVTPAPTGMMSPNQEMEVWDWLPSSSAMQMNFLALHEMLGRWWYRYRHYGGASN